ncbi:hypothetical protein Htur_5013 (plasmid) [Haloterrigena turkmenica DSM 5511]|uniref:Uncharacterized protein n=1 Tax=Haloterrigena turkmenica (strain ATCC 51198 / DSM 5511 / JCM 9101 / NCIMB 13204 / VKM B-1734 / 4k) TaxID=543526 RepID=D2S3F4_HALTV|nr:hypothetical protein Htur_5013 [Haloterrigena turkmenica DSM 5511]
MVINWLGAQLERLIRYWSVEYEWHVMCESCDLRTVVSSKEDAVYIGAHHQKVTLEKQER